MTEASVGTDRPLPDYYDVMHLHPAADAAMVDQVYWHLARLYNAAIATDGEARAKLDALNQAYAVLRSPALREQYDEARGEAPGGRAPAHRAQTEREEPPPPLTVMDTQRPRDRDGSKAGKSRPERAWPRLRLPRVPGLGKFGQSVPSWQNAVSAAIIAALATAALIARVEPVLIAVLLIAGLSFTMLPLARKLPRLPALPRPALPSLRMPRLSLRIPKRSNNADSLQQSTEAMLSRWRAGAASRAGSDSDKPAPLQDEDDNSAR